MSANELSHIVVAASAPDHPQPATASLVQNHLGAYNAAAFDVNSVYSGFVDTMTVAERLLHAASNGGYALVIGVPAGGSRLPASAQTLAAGDHFFKMNGRGVRGFVEANPPDAVHGLLAKAGVAHRDIQHFVPHQANGVMLGAVWPRLGLDAAT